MSQNEINQLSKLLTIRYNNIENIKNILKYSNKLEDINIFLLPEIKDIIFKILVDLEKNDIDIETLTHNDMIYLLKTHRNKDIVRKIIYNNLGKIILYNFLNIEVKNLNDLTYVLKLSDKFNINVLYDLIIYNIEKNRKKLQRVSIKSC